jgi:hypothetical protein
MRLPQLGDAVGPTQGVIVFGVQAIVIRFGKDLDYLPGAAGRLAILNPCEGVIRGAIKGVDAIVLEIRPAQVGEVS